MDLKTALITGASGGIGSACSKALAENGFRVILHYNHSKQKVEEIMDNFENVHLVQADLSNLDDIDKIHDFIRKELGLGLDVLVNNAGIALDNPIFSATVEEFEKTIQVNLRSTWYLTKKLSRLMIRQNGGRIINISSIIGSIGNPAQSLYGMTKAAINNFTKTIALELAGHNILVNSVAPGFIDTEMTRNIKEENKAELLKKIPLKRMGKPEEVAEVVLFLATSGNYCSGSVFHVNGGLYGGS